MTADSRVIVLTRDAAGNRRWAAELKQCKLPVLAAPMIETRPVARSPEIENTLGHLSEFDWLVLTSARAVLALTTLAKTAGIPLYAPPSVAAVGPATAASTRAAGLTVAFEARPSTAAALAKQLAPVKDRRVLWAGSDKASAKPVAALRTRGAIVTELTIYQTRPRNRRHAKLEQALSQDQVRCLVFTSPSAITGLLASLSPTALISSRSLPAITIGPTTTSAARHAGFRQIIQATEPTIQSLIASMNDLAG